jgi:hypothetical protein
VALVISDESPHALSPRSPALLHLTDEVLMFLIEQFWGVIRGRIK